MKPNKSIDGLATRDAKNSSASIDGLETRATKVLASQSKLKKSQPETKKTQNNSKRVLTEEKKISKNLNLAPENLNPTSKNLNKSQNIIEDSLEIEVEDDFLITPIKTEPKKSAKKPSEKLKSNEKSSEKPKTAQKPKSRDEIVNDFLSPVEAFKIDDDEDEDDDNDKDEDKKDKNAKKDTNKNQDESRDDTLDNFKKTKKPKRVHKVRRIVLTIILILLAILAALMIWGGTWLNDVIAKVTGGQGNLWSLFTFMEEKYDPLKTDANGRTNILAFGTSGWNMDGDEGNGIHDGAQLTDSIMMISLNHETGDIAMLSLPRDLKASPTCTATGKINEVYWCNGGGGSDLTIEQENTAAAALMKEVGSILGVEFQYYAHLNWGSLESIVDILGGITITLDEDISDKYWTGATYKAGESYTINGYEAIALSRARHGTIGGDFSRAASQQKILIGIKDKLLEKHLSILDTINLVSTLGDNLRTNFSPEEIKTIAYLSSEFDFDSMRQLPLVSYTGGTSYLTTGMINNISYVLPLAGVGNYGAIQSYVAKQLSNDPRIYENPSILVLNATEITGLAATEKNALLDNGYPSVSTDNAPEGDYYNGTTVYATNNDKPGTKLLLEQYYNTNVLSADELPADISRDYDFIIIINLATEDTK